MATLTLYPSAGEPYTMKQRVRKQQFTFADTIPRPTVAMLRIGRGAPVYLWIEAAEMTFAYNPTQPAASAVTGSRSNSEYRYALEQCRQDAMAHGGDNHLPQALLHYAGRYRTAAYVPFLLWLHYCGDDADALDKVCGRFEGAAAEAYHLPLLQQRVTALRDCREGCRVTAIAIPTEAKRLQSLDSLCGRAAATFLLVSPTWLEQQRHQADSLRHIIASLGVDAQVLWVPLDKVRHGWDDPFMQSLCIQYVPYIMLLDNTARILTRDVRLWEARRLLEALALPPTTLSAVAPELPAPKTARQQPHW